MKETRGLHLIFGVLLLVYFVPISASDKVVKVPTVLNLSAFDSSDNRNGGESANRSSRTSNLGKFPPGMRTTAIPSSNGEHSKSPFSSDSTGVNNHIPTVTEKSPEGPDSQAAQRAFLVLAGLGILVVGYFAIKFACVKKRRRERNSEESRYGLIETSEMDALDNEDDDGEDDTLFDLRSHRRT